MDEEIEKLATEMNKLAKQAVLEYGVSVNSIISTKTLDQNQIEHTLDGMVDFCFDNEMLVLYKKLCLYYYYINPEATVDYVNIYREMWDNEYLEREGKI
jgi:hypothetical protein